ncbi:MAG: FAD-dependent oxidoreductase, partial [Acidobacteriaceae bacterium]|nr:FAD-dependent oxidoreductase [Acidobacteriaceae bacterium]
MNADVAVVGSGPAGMAAAIAASTSGAQVVILDDNPAAGGQIWRGMDDNRSNRQARNWFRRFAALQSSVVSNSRVISVSAP